MVNPSNSRDSRAIVGPETYNTFGNWFYPNHECITTTTMGRITPIMVMPTLPGDYFEISTEVFTRFAPLYLPIMARVDMALNYFYVPNRVLWPKPHGWENFITQQEDIEAPWITFYGDDTFGPHTPIHYLGTPQGSTVTEQYTSKISALPLAALIKVFDDYFRNPHLTQELFKPLVNGDNNGDGGDINSYQSLAIRTDWCYDLWNRDYFTTALPTPLAGEDILLPLVNENYKDPVADHPSGPYTWRTSYDDTPPTSGTITTAGGGLTQRGSGVNVYLDIMETAPSILQVRKAQRLFEFMEHVNKTSFHYPDFIKGEFNVDPFSGLIDQSQWIGGAKTQVIISEVMSQADFENLGFYGGQAIAAHGGKQIDYFCQEHGYIIATLVIKPRTQYQGGLNKHWTRLMPLDYPFVEFADIGDQEILGKELAYQNHNDFSAFNDEVFGYTQRFQDWKTQPNLISGEMVNFWQNYHLARYWNYPNLPALNTEFVTCKPRVQDIFKVVEGEDEIFIYAFHNIRVKRRLPAISIGRS